MTRLTTLESWTDDRGNRIEYAGRLDSDVVVTFTGSNNTLRVADKAYIAALTVEFNCDNGLVDIGPTSHAPPLRASIRVGQDASVLIGSNVSATTRVAMSAVEGVTVRVGDDVMFASNTHVRADDGHPIFDVRTGKRVNPARDIEIGAHVWVGFGAAVLGGSTIGSGTVIGMSSVVKGRFPNNCIVAGVPARLVKRDIAWERPHLSLNKPFYKPDASTIKRSRQYWQLTDDGRRRTRLRPRRIARALLVRIGRRRSSTHG